MRETKVSDPEFEEALEKCTELLQKFINRQQQLRLMIEGKIPREDDVAKLTTEKLSNSVIINYIQWVRYHLWGNSDEVIDMKTDNLVKRWMWIYGSLQLSLWSVEALGIEDQVMKMNQNMFVWPEVLIECIIKLISPQRSNSIFGGLMNGNYGSINLEHEIGRMRDKMNKYGHGPIY